MMPSRKRTLEDANGTQPEESPLKRIRGMWQFANLSQWIYTFGKAAKIDDSIDIEEIEAACLNPQSTILNDIALALLKLISSHRGLTHDIFDSQARKQYLDKDPASNPFGTEESPAKFQDFDVFTKIKVLQQMTQWTMIYPERIREKMEEQKDTEQTSWRIEPYGWDSDDRTYFVLDDNRVYRLTEAPPAPPVAPKSKSKKKASRRGRRSSKRQRTQNSVEEDHSECADADDNAEPEDDGLGGMTWECLAVTLDEVRQLLDGFRKTRDENEKILRRQLEDHLVPILEKQEESMKRKALQRERELLNMAKMANAKRSSRIAGKVEQRKQEEKTKEELQQQRMAEELRRKEEREQLKREKERDFRMASRGQRLKEREARRQRHEEDLAQLSEDSRRLDDGEGRGSGRRLQAEIERKRQELKDLEDEDEDWIFDCACGLYGQVDDGSHSVACEGCNVWQHSKCLGVSEEEAERPEFHFVCEACRRRREEAKNKPKATIKLRLLPSPKSSKQQHRAIDGSTTEHGRLVSTTDSIQKGINSYQDTVEVPISSYMLQDETSRWLHSRSTSLPRSIPAQAPARQPFDIADSNVALKPQSRPEYKELSNEIVSTPAMEHHPGYPQRSEHSETVVKTPSTSLAQPDGHHGSPSSAMSTPAVSRDMCRPAHVNQDTLPAQPGISPIKTSPQSSFTSTVSGSNNTAPTKLPPGLTLSPSRPEPILTPPTKHS